MSICVVNENGEVECYCLEECMVDFDLVCGFDGCNYSNKCQLQIEVCKLENLNILRFQYVGLCGKNVCKYLILCVQCWLFFVVCLCVWVEGWIWVEVLVGIIVFCVVGQEILF